MREHLDSVASYVIGGLAVTHSWLATNSTNVMLYGGLLVLGMRIYTDGVKFIKTWKERRNG